MFIKKTLRKKEAQDFISNNALYKVALIIDEKVIDIITCNERLCAILTSNPTIIGYPSDADGVENIKPGWKYSNGVFQEAIE